MKRCFARFLQAMGISSWVKFLSVFFLMGLFGERVGTIDPVKLKNIETFLSAMNTLNAAVTMEIFQAPNSVRRHVGEIWLDRPRKLLRIDYGNDKIIAKNGVLFIKEGNGTVQEFATEDTPAGLLLRPKIKFGEAGINVIAMFEEGDALTLALTYLSPMGEVPLTLYFKERPIMLLLGWVIENPDGAVTKVALDPDATHMAIPLVPAIFE